jgi:hypothetical protein
MFFFSEGQLMLILQLFLDLYNNQLMGKLIYSSYFFSNSYYIYDIDK